MDRREAFRSMFALSGAWVSARGLEAQPLPAQPDARDPGDDEAYWSRLRWQFLIPRDQAYFNTGTLGASPRPVVEAVRDHLLFVEESLAEWDYSPEKPERRRSCGAGSPTSSAATPTRWGWP